MRKIVLTAVAASMLLTACTGPFAWTKQLHNWQTNCSNNEWVQELAFIGCAILPYGFTVFCDAIIFNSIEFWTGNNPIASKTIEVDGKVMEMRLVDANTISVQSDGEEFFLVKTDDKIIAKNADGVVLN